MSIINDAIKKARKEFESRLRHGAARREAPKDIAKEERPVAVASESSDIKWITIVTVSLVLIVSLLGSIFLYRHMSRLNTIYSTEEIVSAKPETPIPFTPLPQKARSFPKVKFEDVVELNGIVYGPEGKWAIINNRIVREGDSLLDGKLVFISKDFVRIKKGDGSELVLELR